MSKGTLAMMVTLAAACHDDSPGTLATGIADFGHSGKTTVAHENRGVGPDVLTVADILSCDFANGWHVEWSPELLVNSSDRVQGAASLALPSGWRSIVSSPLMPLSTGDYLTFSLKVPTKQPNASWYGTLQVAFQAPSVGVASTLGTIDLLGVPPGTWKRIAIPVSSAMQARMGQSIPDAVLSFISNNGSTDPVLVDDIRLQTTTSAMASLQADNASALGFEASGLWRISELPGGVPVGSVDVGGGALLGTGAMNIRSTNHVRLTSPLLGSLGKTRNLALEVQLPTAVPGGSGGQVQLVVDLPSQGISSQTVATMGLPSTPASTWLPVRFTLPASVQTALGASYSDLKLALVFDLPTTAGVYRVDDLHSESCTRSDVSLTNWPLAGQQGKDWVINNIVDLDPSGKIDPSMLVDATGRMGNLAITYKNSTWGAHKGWDFDLPTFVSMDDGSAQVRAAAPGLITQTLWTDDDRHRIMGGPGNHVIMLHRSGYTFYYWHFRAETVPPVAVGQWVDAGGFLAVAGSSGNSSTAHLHFEIQNCDGEPVEPLGTTIASTDVETGASMWVSQPSVPSPSGVMALTVSNTEREAFDPCGVGVLSCDSAQVQPGDLIWAVASLARGELDELQTELVSPNGEVVARYIDKSSTKRRAGHYPSVQPFTAPCRPGVWKVVERLLDSAGTVLDERSKTITIGDAVEHVQLHLSSTELATAAGQLSATGQLPTWIDGYRVGGSDYYNLVSCDGAAQNNAALLTDLSDTDFGTRFGTWPTSPALNLAQADVYPRGSNFRYAGIYQRGPGDAMYFNMPEANAEDSDFVGTALSPSGTSGAVLGGNATFLALYGTLGGRIQTIAASDYQALFDTSLASGWYPRSLDAYQDSAGPRYTALFVPHPVGNEMWARHAMSLTEVRAENTRLQPLGYHMLTVTGYEDGGNERFAAVWSNSKASAPSPFPSQAPSAASCGAGTAYQCVELVGPSGPTPYCYCLTI